jgi:hypothetical protein
MRDKIIDITQTRREAVAIERFAHLWGLAEHGREQLLKNPEPFLAEAARRIARYERLIDELKLAVFPLPVFDPAIDRCPLSLSGEAIVMIEKVRNLLTREP